MGNKTSRTKHNVIQTKDIIPLMHEELPIQSLISSTSTLLNELDLQLTPVFQKETTCYKLMQINCEKIIKNCTHLERLSIGLKYHNLCVDKKEKFIEFCEKIYVELLNDIIHIIKLHGGTDDLVRITDELTKDYGFKKCKLSNCKKLERHYRRGRFRRDKNTQPDETDEFYSSCFDQIHHYIFHLFELGLRTNSPNVDLKQDNEHFHDDFSRIDGIFKARRDLLRNRRKQCGFDVEKYNAENNKFNLHIAKKNAYIGKDNDQQYTQDISATENFKSLRDIYGVSKKNVLPTGATEVWTKAKQIMNKYFEVRTNTFLDEINELIRTNKNVSDIVQKKLKYFIIDNEYDSDAVQYDLYGISKHEMQTCSNIYHIVNNQMCVDLIVEAFRIMELSSQSFSTGFVFFYYDYYKNDREKQVGDWLHGCCPAELFVSSRFSCLKEEILRSGYISITEWIHKIVFKANKFHQTHKVKKIKCQTHTSEAHHGYRKFSVILAQHLMCIILYTDWSSLCTEFSATFRKDKEFEPLEFVKKRHSYYYHFGKGLTEVVNSFGIDGIGAIRNGIWRGDGEPGPFYCGLSVVINMPSFAIYLKGPCSTTKNIEIAITFAKRDGMIMELQND
eukprot:181815_1